MASAQGHSSSQWHSQIFIAAWDYRICHTRTSNLPVLLPHYKKHCCNSCNVISLYTMKTRNYFASYIYQVHYKIYIYIHLSQASKDLKHGICLTACYGASSRITAKSCHSIRQKPRLIFMTDQEFLSQSMHELLCGTKPLFV